VQQNGASHQNGTTHGSVHVNGAQSLEHDVEILQSIRRIIRSVEMYSKKLSSCYKITGPQLVCLLTIGEHQPITASKIAKQVHLSPSTVVGVLDRLEEKDLIVRERDHKDRRKVHINLTDKGGELASGAPSPLQDKLAQALKGLSPLEQSTIALALQKIAFLMEDTRP
jgi:DNA-binding MarR family transcriptional regulator